MEEKEISFRLEMAKQSDAATIAFSEKSMLYAFYLNGGAATALLARGQEVFYPAAASFAMGAFWAVMCMGLVYSYQLLLTYIWRKKLKKHTLYAVEAIRILPITAWCLSMFQFLRGIAKL